MELGIAKWYRGIDERKKTNKRIRRENRGKARTETGRKKKKPLFTGHPCGRKLAPKKGVNVAIKAHG